MQIKSSLIPSAANLIAEIQSGKVTGVQHSREAERPLTDKAVMGSKQADEALLRLRRRDTVYQDQVFQDPRSRRALDAYQTLDRSAEREYVSSILGIDEYV